MGGGILPVLNPLVSFCQKGFNYAFLNNVGLRMGWLNRSDFFNVYVSESNSSIFDKKYKYL